MSRARRLGPSVDVTPFPWLGTAEVVQPALAGSPSAPAAADDVGQPSATARPAASLSEIERQAFAKGYEHGERSGLEAGGLRLEAMLRRMTETLEELGSLRQQMIQQTESQIVQLALTIAKRILRREVSLDQDLTVAMARVALDRLGEHSGATIRMNPEDYALTTSSGQDQLESDQVTIVADDGIDRGGCRIESAFGFVDASVDAQFEEIEKAVMAGEATTVKVADVQE